MNEAGLLQIFQPFGDIIEVQIPRDGKSGTGRHRGFGFITFSARSEAEDAIDNMHLNTIAVPGAAARQQERVINVTLAKPMKTAMTAAGNRAVWVSEEWVKQYGSGEEQAAASEALGVATAGPAAEAMETD